MANTAWSATDKSGSATLTGSNLIVTAAAVTQWARAADKQVTGKFYWETKPTVWVSANTATGFCPGTVATPNPATGLGFCALFKGGTIFTNNANSGTLGARAANDVISIAVDLDASLAWFRVAPAGNWNGSGTANPATGVGGISVLGIAGIGIPTYPLALITSSADSITANFGDSAFTGTVPSGFTSGFTAGAAPASNTLVTQVALEHWVTVATAPVGGGAQVSAMVLA